MECNDSEKITQHCYNKIYRTSGCTIPIKPVRQVYSNQTTIREVKEDLAKISNSDNPVELKRCYGDSTDIGYGSQLPYFTDSNDSQCTLKLKEKGDLIKCDSCDTGLGRKEGVWFYKDGKRVQIPDCNCPAAFVAADIKVKDDRSRNVCGNSYQKGKPIEIITNDCAIYDAWNNPDINWYYGGKGMGSNNEGGIPDDDTIFYTSPTTIYQIPSGKCTVQCQGNTVNICNKTRVKSCNETGSNCQKDCTITVPNQLQPKNLDPKCFYRIPFTNGGGPVMNYKFGDKDIQITAMNCQDPTYFHTAGLDAVVYVNNPTPSYPGPVYIFRQKEYFRLKAQGDFYQVDDGYPQPILSGWRGITSDMLPMDTAYYDDTTQVLHIFKNDTVNLYGCKDKKILSSHRIGEYYPGIPNLLDAVSKVGGSMLFFKGDRVYQTNTPQVLLGPFPTVLPSPMCIILKLTGMCLDFFDWQTQDPHGYKEGGGFRLSPCRGDFRQQWVYDNWSQIIMNPVTGLCLDYNGTELKSIYPYGGAYQRWRYRDGYLVNILSGGVLQADPTLNDGSNFGIRVGKIPSDIRFALWTAPFGTDDEDWSNSKIESKATGGVGGQKMCMTTANPDPPGYLIDTTEYYIRASNGKALNFTGQAAKLYPKGNITDLVAWRFISGGDSKSPNTFYLQNTWKCKERERRCGEWLSFTGYNLLLYSKDNLTGRVPWEFVQHGNGNKYKIKNLWRCNKGESRCGMYIGISGDNVKLTNEKNAEIWTIEPRQQIRSLQKSPVSLIEAKPWQNLPNQRWIYVPENHSVINPATGYRLAIVGNKIGRNGLPWNSATGRSLLTWVKSGGWDPSKQAGDSGFIVAIPPNSGDRLGVSNKGGCFRWFILGLNGEYIQLTYAAFGDGSFSDGPGPLNYIYVDMAPPPLPGGIKPWLQSGWWSCHNDSRVQCGGPSDWIALTHAPLGSRGIGGEEGLSLYFLSNASSELAIGSTSNSSPDNKIREQHISINDYATAQKIAGRMGGRVAYEYELKTSGLLNQGLQVNGTNGLDKVSGWITTYSNRQSADSGKRYIAWNKTIAGERQIRTWVPNGSEKSSDLTGVWMVAKSTVFKDLGERVCNYQSGLSGNVWLTSPEALGTVNQQSRWCNVLGGCFNTKSTAWCTNTDFEVIKPEGRPIPGVFAKIPNYLNTVLYDQKKLYFFKNKQVYTYGGHSASNTAKNQGVDNVKISLITSLFHNYPVLPNLYLDINQKTDTMADEYIQFERRDLQTYRMNHKILESGGRALSKSRRLLDDKNELYQQRTQKLKSLDSTIQTDQRQGGTAQYSFSRLDFYNKYLKYGLTVMLVEIIIVFVYKGNLLSGFTKKKTITTMLAILAIFGVIIVPIIINDFRGSKFRWGKLRWNPGKLPPDNYKDPDKRVPGIQSLTTDVDKVKQDIKNSKCSKKTTSMTDTTKTTFIPTNCSK